ncbi:MAG: hypothetical protein AVDCRST_MAG88-3837, partial [uncultured Thermomicrobiales bacterium]
CGRRPSATCCESTRPAGCTRRARRRTSPMRSRIAQPPRA